eukprot:symbB.v1.2.030664.t1/scaffold3482.1/size55780/2
MWQRCHTSTSTATCRDKDIPPCSALRIVMFFAQQLKIANAKVPRSADRPTHFPSFGSGHNAIVVGAVVCAMKVRRPGIPSGETKKRAGGEEIFEGVCLNEGIQILLAEGLGPDVAKSYNERREKAAEVQKFVHAVLQEKEELRIEDRAQINRSMLWLEFLLRLDGLETWQPDEDLHHVTLGSSLFGCVGHRARRCMWPGLDVPTLAGVKGHGGHESRGPPSGFADVKESNVENLDTLLRVSAGGSRDYILPAKCLDELSPNVPNSEMREIFQKHAIATIPGSGLSYIEKCSAVRKLPVCMSGEAGLEIAKRCQDSGLRPELLCSKEGYQLCNNNDREVSLVPGQSLTSTENGKKVPYLKPRTRLSADERSKLRLPGPARRSKAIDMGLFEPAQAKVVLIDDEAAAKSRLETAASSILKQIDFIIGESLGFLGSAEENELDTGKSSLRSSLEAWVWTLPTCSAPAVYWCA